MPESAPRRKLAAILAGDVVGFSKLMGENEDRTLRNLKACRSLTDESIATYHGRIFGSAGDSVIAEFASPVDAIVAAVEFQRNLRYRNARAAPEDRMQFRVGLNLGDVIVEGDNLYGDGVNVAARLEAASEAGSICVSGKFYEEVRRKLDLSFVSLGKKQMKNIEEPILAYQVSLEEKTHQRASPSDSEASADGGQGYETRPPAIAVLPFDNMSGDPEQEYFVDGITEDIISVISRYRWLSIIARNSTFVYKGKAVDVREVARDLKVDYVLEGSVRKAGARVRVTAQLIDAESGSHLWTERYDRNLDDIFALQDEITETIAASIEPELARSERQRARRKTAGSLGAWDLFQQAQWHMFQFSKENIETAIDLYRQAIVQDEEFASAQAGISVGNLVMVIANYTDDPKNCIQSALTHAERAVVLDDQDPFAHYALGRAYAFSRQPEKSERELKRAIDLNPSYAHAYHGLAQSFMMSQGSDGELIVKLMNDAIRLSPNDPLLWAFENVMAAAHLEHLQRDDEALEWWKKSASHPNAGFWAFAGLAASHSLLGQQEEAESSLAKVLELNPDLSQSYLDATYPGVLLRFKKGLALAGLS
jgi:TolB-like protein/class 3 adenylate cyclase